MAKFFHFILLLITTTNLLAQTPPVPPKTLRPGDFLALAKQTPAVAKANCDGSEIVVTSPVVLDFNGPTPTYTGDPALQPYFSHEGNAPGNYIAVFNLGSKKLRLATGASIRVLAHPSASGPSLQPAPGLRFRTSCEIVVAQGASITVDPHGETGGVIELLADGNLAVDGVITNSHRGTSGNPSGINLVSFGGNLTLETNGRIRSFGENAGAGGITLHTHGVNATLTVRGLIETTYDAAQTGPAVSLIAFDGNVLIDGTQQIGTDYETGRPLTGGVVIQSRGSGRGGSISVQSQNDVAINGYSGTPLVYQAPFFQINDSISGSDIVDVTLELREPAHDTVEVRVSIAAGSGDMLQVVGNVTDHALLNHMAVESDGIVTAYQFRADRVGNLGGGANVNPAKKWDWGVKLGAQGSSGGYVESAVFRLTSPGLTAHNLVAEQKNGWVFGVRIQSTNGGEGSAKMGLKGPAVLKPVNAFGALAIKTPQREAGRIDVNAVNGKADVSGYALDVRANHQTSGVINVHASGPVTLSGTPGDGPTLDSRGAGFNHVRSRDAHVTVGAGCQMLAGSLTNRLTACSGVRYEGGTVSPADLDPSDDTGVCVTTFAVTVANPSEGGLVGDPSVSLNGDVAPAGAEVLVNGQTAFVVKIRRRNARFVQLRFE